MQRVAHWLLWRKRRYHVQVASILRAGRAFGRLPQHVEKVTLAELLDGHILITKLIDLARLLRHACSFNVVLRGRLGCANGIE